MSILDGVTRVLFVHAHPDDESISTGALIAYLRDRDVDVRLVTCTRGEAGELRPGILPDTAAREEFIAHRETELAAACAALDVRDHVFLGLPPASADDIERSYPDSGMTWVAPGVAGPDPSTPDTAFARIDPALPGADLAALVDAWNPDLLLTYDDHGGYGHPDHLRARELCRGVSGARVVEFLLAEDLPDDATVIDLEPYRDAARRALKCYSSQLTLIDEHTIEHVGGQREPIAVRVGLREVTA